MLLVNVSCLNDYEQRTSIFLELRYLLHMRKTPLLLLLFKDAIP